MKALMSVGALIGVVGLLLLVGMIFDVVPSNTVRLVEGYMPMQVLFELTAFVAGFAGLSYLMAFNSAGVMTMVWGVMKTRKPQQRRNTRYLMYR